MTALEPVAGRSMEPLNFAASEYFDRHDFVYSVVFACTHIGHSDTLVSVRVIARSTLREFVETLKGTKNYAPVKSALDAWFHEVEAAGWKTPAEVKAAYANASIVGGDRVVFNIKGNSFRLVVAVDYLRQLVFIKWVGNHADYDRIDAAKVSYADKADKK